MKRIPFLPILFSCLFFTRVFSQPIIGIKSIDWIIYANHTPDKASRLLETTIQYYNPPDSPLYYMQVVIPVQFSSATYWAGQNIPLIPFQDTVELSFTVPADSLNYHDSVPFTAQLCGFAYASQWYMSKPALPYQFQTLPVNPARFNVGNQDELTPGGVDLSHLSYSPVKPIDWTLFDTIKIYFRGCRVPNIDLNDSIYGDLGTPTDPNYAGDKNACGPAACTNSFMWLMTQHPEIQQKLDSAGFKGDTLARKMIEEFSRLMMRTPSGTVKNDTFIKAKLAFIDKYKLPVHVKFQSIIDSISNKSTLASPDSAYGHSASNLNLPVDTHMVYKRISWDYIKKEMEDGEDVEAFLIWRNPHSPTASFGHYITLTGFMQQGAGAKRISFKDDWYQNGAGGARHRLVELHEDSDGTFSVPELSDTILGKCFLTSVVSESFDQSIVYDITGVGNNILTGPGFMLNGNPVSPASTLIVKGINSGTVRMEITMIDGRVLTQLPVNITSPYDIVPVGSYFNNLPPGIYLMHLIAPNGFNKTLKIVADK